MVVRRHAEWGERILGDSAFYALARTIARHHHENWDGTGYPDRLARRAIPIAARIVKVADVFDALINVRPYKPAWPPEEALAEIRRLKGVQMDPDVVAAFEGVCEEHFGPAGVRLPRSRRTARPRVLRPPG